MTPLNAFGWFWKRTVQHKGPAAFLLCTVGLVVHVLGEQSEPVWGLQRNSGCDHQIPHVIERVGKNYFTESEHWYLVGEGLVNWTESCRASPLGSEYIDRSHDTGAPADVVSEIHDWLGCTQQVTAWTSPNPPTHRANVLVYRCAESLDEGVIRILVW